MSLERLEFQCRVWDCGRDWPGRREGAELRARARAGGDVEYSTEVSAERTGLRTPDNLRGDETFVSSEIHDLC